VIAFPVREADTEKEYFFPTCLSINEINKLDLILPPPAYALHYDPAYKMPEVRNWDSVGLVLAYYKAWKRRVPLQPPTETEADKMSWSKIGHTISDAVRMGGFGEGSRLLFLDHAPGPCAIRLAPGEPEPRHVELEDLKRYCPGEDWERIIAEQRAANPAWYGSAHTSGQP
jgi:hypothetical protein